MLHIVAASSAGGLKAPFPTSKEDVSAYAQGVHVNLEIIDVETQRLGFVRKS